MTYRTLYILYPLTIYTLGMITGAALMWAVL